MKKTLGLVFIFIILSLALIFLQTTPSNAEVLGEWPMFRKDPFHSGFSSEETSLDPPLELKWTFPAGGGPSSPAVAEGMVYVEFGGVLFARDAKTGNLIWSQNTPAYDHSSVAVAYGMVFDGSGKYPECQNCGIVAYDVLTGIEEWRMNLPIGAHSPNVDDGVLYFGSDDRYVRAVNAYNGQLLWTSPRLNDGVVAVPAVASGRVFVGTWNGLLYALNSVDGQILWQAYTGGVTFSSPSVINNTVYVGSGTENVYAFDALSGAEKWKYTGGKDSVWGSPAIAYGNLYIQDLAGYIHAIDANNGNLVWLYHTGAQPSSSYSSPAVANGIVYVGSQDKSIYAFDAFTGNVLWKYDTDGIVNSSPAIADGMLYVSSNDGYIYAFGNVEPTPPPTPTPVPTIGPFELPFNYEGRPAIAPLIFKSAFWERLTAAFDHVLRGGMFRPFTGNTYAPSECPRGIYGITCYDSHNGTDFSRWGSQDVYSVSNGTIAYASEHTSSSCTPNRGGYGCVIIAEYSNNTFGLFAHLDKILVNENDPVNVSSLIGEMGNTGCPSCGEHLHFGVLTPKGISSTLARRGMSRRDWQELIYAIKPFASPKYRPTCSYIAPNGLSFNFQDPSGWSGDDMDPWNKARSDNGCGINSPYLWKFDVGTSP